MPSTSKVIYSIFPLILGLLLIGTYCKSNSYQQNVQQNQPFTFQVVDSTTLEPLNGVMVEYVSGDWKLTKRNGTIRISRYRINQQIRLSKWGYTTKTLRLDSSKLISSKIYLNKVTRIEESGVKAITINSSSLIEHPSSIEKISSKDIRNATTFNYYELIGKQRGMSLHHSGILATSPSALGFGRIGNPRILQIDDGVNYQLPYFNYRIGNINGISELDIESVEVIPIGATSLYGPGASNGLIKINSKDPFNFPGLSAQAKIGTNAVQTISGTDFTPIYKFDLRFAKSIIMNRRFSKGIGLKGVFYYVETMDWQPLGGDNTNLTGNQDESRTTDPGFDGANVFGDEFRFILPFGPAGSDEIITRTGYHESYLLDYTAKSIQLNLGIYWKISNNITVSLEVEPSEATTVFSGKSRLELPEMTSDKVKFSVQGKEFMMSYYELSRDMGNSFDTKLLGRNLNFYAKGSTSWLQDYTAAYGGAITNVPPQDHPAARAFADSQGLNIFNNPFIRSWVSPMESGFQGIVDQLITNQAQGFLNFPVQSEFQGSTTIENLDLQFDFSRFLKFVNLKVGYLNRKIIFEDIDPFLVPQF
ncbi:MAG: TonB-dependent receptor, partial [Bacteroidetes bacterium]|nr:TonB-dependent receptor [Bacteroidota bacterium]